MSEKLATVLKQLRAGYATLFGERLAGIVLFGSQARGDAKPDSDIDVLVVLKGPVQAGEEGRRARDFKAALCLEHDVVIMALYISESRFLQEQSPLLLNVRREGVPL